MTAAVVTSLSPAQAVGWTVPLLVCYIIGYLLMRHARGIEDYLGGWAPLDVFREWGIQATRIAGWIVWSWPTAALVFAAYLGMRDASTSMALVGPVLFLVLVIASYVGAGLLLACAPRIVDKRGPGLSRRSRGLRILALRGAGFVLWYWLWGLTMVAGLDRLPGL